MINHPAFLSVLRRLCARRSFSAVSVGLDRKKIYIIIIIMSLISLPRSDFTI